MASPPVLEDPHIASRRAKTRVGVAVVLLSVAVGGLTLLSRQRPEPVEDRLDASVQQKQESVSSADSETPPQVPEAVNSATQEPPAPATPAETLPPPPPPPPPVVNQPLPEPTRSTPATPTSVSAAPEPAAPLAPTPAATLAKPAPARSLPAEQPVRPLPVKAEPAPRAFLVQVGVFTDMDNARQLQAKLTEHGIPSHTETKLQLGPFNTKAEADAAQQKLKALGMGAVVLPLK